MTGMTKSEREDLQRLIRQREKTMKSAACAFVEKLPTVESLMPALSYQEIAGEADPPVIEQLVSPNALRQRRFRKKQKVLRNAQNVTPGALRNSPDNAAEAGS